MDKKIVIGIAIASAIAVIVPLVVIASSSSAPAKTTDNSKVKVVASFFPMYEFTKNVAGDRAEVVLLIANGDEPHGWEPNTQELQVVQNAQLFIYNGAGIESFVPNLSSLGNFPHTTFVKASAGIQMLNADVKNLDEEEAKPIIEQGGKDPHVWNDPVLAQQEVRNIANALEKTDPTNGQYYEANANAYNGKLAKLDQDIKSALSNCKTQTFVSFHNAFSYFTQRYGLTDVWITGIAPESEVSPQDIARVEDLAKEHNVKIIFSEDLVDPKLAQSLAADIGAQTKVLSPLEGLDHQDQQNGVTFIDKWYKNVDNLKDALECQ
ncbi:MAG TPA: zinc ABC transporter substrate-binding protein [Nitrososphaera sp.]